jgi:hypothetical protein
LPASLQLFCKFLARMHPDLLRNLEDTGLVLAHTRDSETTEVPAQGIREKQKSLPEALPRFRPASKLREDDSPELRNEIDFSCAYSARSVALGSTCVAFQLGANAEHRAVSNINDDAPARLMGPWAEFPQACWSATV